MLNETRWLVAAHSHKRSEICGGGHWTIIYFCSLIPYLESSALVGEFPDPVQHDVDDFLADGVVASSVVVGGIFLPSDKLFWVKQLTVRPGADLVWR